MFKSVSYKHANTPVFGDNQYVYELKDTDFTYVFSAKTSSNASILSWLVKIYRTKNLNVSDNIALYYIWKYHSKQILQIVRDDEANMSMLFPELYYYRYVYCIVNRVKAHMWVRGKSV